MGRGFQITFKVPEIKATLDQLNAYNGKERLRVENVIQSSTKNIARGARNRVPVRTGNLKKKISSRFNRVGKYGPYGTVSARRPYAHLVEFGAKGTTVAPKNKKAMTIDEYGIRRYAQKAKIPARKERPYMRPAFEDEKPKLIRDLKGAVQP